MDARDIIGTWRLVAYEVRSESGALAYPLGRDLAGYLIYTADGHMSATLMRPGRPKFAAGDLLGGTAEEKVAAADGYVAYCGTYRLEGATVVHHVELSLFPNWIGGDQERSLGREGDRLVVSTPPMLLQGERRVSRLVWERAR